MHRTTPDTNTMSHLSEPECWIVVVDAYASYRDRVIKLTNMTTVQFNLILFAQMMRCSVSSFEAAISNSLTQSTRQLKCIHCFC